ncbi:MAG: GAF domain-containing sensor histidine kinase [Acidimicrobiia bacterium]
MAQPVPLDRLTDLVDAAAGVVGETDLDKVLRRLVTEARAETGARYAALGVLGEHGVLSGFLYEGIGDEEAAEIGRLPTGRGVLGTVIRLKETIRLDEISDHPDTVGFPPNHPPMHGFLGVPVAVGDEAFGNLYLTEKAGGFTERDVAVAETLSRIAGAAVRTARLQARLRRVAVVEDRQRIARDLHDSVIQEMFAVGLSLQGLSQLVDSPQAETTLLDAVDRLDHSVEALRRYIFELRSAEGPTRDLASRLQEVVARMGSAYPATVTLEVSDSWSDDTGVDDEIVMVVTEALSNALRHSGAETVEVVVTGDAAGCDIRVHDDGHGFDLDAPVSGMGLQNLRNRVATLGGELRLLSSESGTDVHASITLT